MRCECFPQKNRIEVCRKPNYQKQVDPCNPKFGIFVKPRPKPCPLMRQLQQQGQANFTVECASPQPRPKQMVVRMSDNKCATIECVPRPQPRCPPTVCLPKATITYQKRQRPADYLYRCESRELRGSNLYAYCECVKRNGLQDDCPRTPCQGRPACLIKPWPNCWPSGGCHGIDFDRMNGVARFNPTLQYRMDNPVCLPPQRGQEMQFDFIVDNGC